MNKKTYIVEESVIRLKPDVEKPKPDDYQSNLAEFDYDYEDEYLKAFLAYNEALAGSPTYPKSGDWGGYEIGQEISEDEVEWKYEINIHYPTNEHWVQTEGDWFKMASAEARRMVAIPKKKEAPATTMSNKQELEAVQFGSSFEADFGEGTWTFKMQRDYRVSAGRFAIIPENIYKQQAEAPATGQGMGEYKVKRVIADLLEKGLIESQHHKKVLMDFISEPTPQESGQGMGEGWIHRFNSEEDFREYLRWKMGREERSDKEIEELAAKTLTQKIREINPEWDYGKTDEEVFAQLWHFFDPPVARRRVIKAMIEMYKQKEDTP